MLQACRTATDAFTSIAAERADEPEAFAVGRIADRAGRSVGCGAFDGATLVGMFVAAPARGVGVGRQLLEAAIAHARGRDGSRVLGLTVTEGNQPALRLYRRAGFQVHGVEPMAVATPSGFAAKRHLWLLLPLAAAPAVAPR